MGFVQRSTDEAVIVSVLENILQEIEDILISINTGAPITGSTPTSVSVGTSSTSVLSSNPNRTALAITNTSVNIVFLAFDNTAVLNSGIALYPGGSVTFDEKVPKGAINAIATAASSNIAIQSFV